MNRFELFVNMVNGTPVKVGRLFGLIQSIEREDGSGHSFNVRVYTIPENEYKTIHVRG